LLFNEPKSRRSYAGLLPMAFGLFAWTLNATAGTTLAVSGAAGEPGANILLTISLDDTGASLPSSVQWDLTYSPTDLALVPGPFYVTGQAAGAAGKVAICNNISPGDVRCLIAGLNTNGIGTGALASLAFHIAAGTTNSSSPVSLVNSEAVDERPIAIATSTSGGVVTIGALPSVTAAAITPTSGTGLSQIFALEYSDSAGASRLQQVYALFNSGLATVQSCEVYYAPGSNVVGLLNDGATAWMMGTPGTAKTLQNSQCSLNVGSTSRTLNGNNLSLNLAMSFAAGYAGAKSVYLWAGDISGVISGWQQLGAWNVSSGGLPLASSVTPSSGSGKSQSFALQYSDSAGGSSLQQVYVLFNASLSSLNSCELYYQPGSNEVGLLNDAGTGWMVSTPGVSTTLQNGQCSLNVASSSRTQSGNNLTLNMAMTFGAGYAGAKSVYLWAGDVSGARSGWQQLGAWTVPQGAGVAAANSVTPNAGSGMSQSFALQYSDTGGAGNFSQVYVLFHSTLSSTNSCELYYSPGTNQVGLLNDAATAWGVATPGTATTLQNSQCSLEVAATTRVLSGNNLTLNVALTFAAGYAGAQNTYLWAGDASGAKSGWQQLGVWTVP
jgi:hypothetical protein